MDGCQCWLKKRKLYIYCISLISQLLSVTNYLYPECCNGNHMAAQNAWALMYSFSHICFLKQTYLNMTCEPGVCCISSLSYSYVFVQSDAIQHQCQLLVSLHSWPGKVLANIPCRSRNLRWQPVHHVAQTASQFAFPMPQLAPGLLITCHYSTLNQPVLSASLSLSLWPLTCKW